MHPIIQSYINCHGKSNPIDLQERIKQHRAAQLEEEEEDTAAYVKRRDIARKRFLDEVQFNRVPKKKKKKKVKRKPNASSKSCACTSVIKTLSVTLKELHVIVTIPCE